MFYSNNSNNEELKRRTKSYEILQDLDQSANVNMSSDKDLLFLEYKED